MSLVLCLIVLSTTSTFRFNNRVTGILYFPSRHGNATSYNMEAILAQSIVSSTYFQRRLLPMSTPEEVFAEIVSQVSDLEAWAPGTARTPSTAFCCLFRLCIIRLTRRDMHGLLRLGHRSPFLPGVGLLYLVRVGAAFCCENP